MKRILCLAFVFIGCKPTTQFSSSSPQPSTGAIGVAPVAAPASQDSQFTASLPSNAITQGHFSVWTVPQDPVPGHSYTIVIAVDLPSGLTSYDKSDLSGQVHGTDGYVHLVGDYRVSFSEHFSFDGKNAQLSINIPGAAAMVQDTIDIGSALLNEHQQIKIVF